MTRRDSALYVAHCSFDSIAEPDDLNPQGYFTCVLEADGMHGALEKLRELLLDTRKRFDGLVGVNNIYLDDLTEIFELPQNGLLAHWSQQLGPDGGTLSASLPDVPESEARSSGYGRKEGQTVPDPFLSFGGT